MRRRASLLILGLVLCPGWMVAAGDDAAPSDDAASSTPLHDAPPALRGDAVYRARLEQALAQPLSPDLDQQTAQLRQRLHLAILARDLQQAGQILDQELAAIQALPQASTSDISHRVRRFFAHLQLRAGWHLRRGQAAQALVLQQQVVQGCQETDQDDLLYQAMQALALYQAHAGFPAQARATWQSIETPDPERDPAALVQSYQLNACALYAALDEPTRASAAYQAAQAAGYRGLLLQRDVLYDPYRQADWFLSLIGPTLAPADASPDSVDSE